MVNGKNMKLYNSIYGMFNTFGTAAGVSRGSRGKNRNKKSVKVDMQRYIEDINFKEMTYNDIIVIR